MFWCFCQHLSHNQCFIDMSSLQESQMEEEEDSEEESELESDTEKAPGTVFR